MALGTTALNELKQDEETILGICNNRMPECFATFDYVVKSLDDWADETVVGQELRKDLSKYATWVRDLNEKTKELCTSMESFIEYQNQINDTANY